MGGIDMEYFKAHGYYGSTSARPITRTPHTDGKFPTPSGKVEILLHDAKNFVAGPFRAMYDGEQSGEPVDPLPGYVAAARDAGDKSGSGQALLAQHHLAEEPRLPELVLRQRAAQDQRPGRAVRDDLASRRREAQYPRRRPGPRLQRPRRFRGRGTRDGRCALPVSWSRRSATGARSIARTGRSTRSRRTPGAASAVRRRSRTTSSRWRASTD